MCFRNATFFRLETILVVKTYRKKCRCVISAISISFSTSSRKSGRCVHIPLSHRTLHALTQPQFLWVSKRQTDILIHWFTALAIDHTICTIQVTYLTSHSSFSIPSLSFVPIIFPDYSPVTHVHTKTQFFSLFQKLYPTVFKKEENLPLCHCYFVSLSLCRRHRLHFRCTLLSHPIQPQLFPLVEKKTKKGMSLEINEIYPESITHRHLPNHITITKCAMQFSLLKK